MNHAIAIVTLVCVDNVLKSIGNIVLLLSLLRSGLVQSGLLRGAVVKVTADAPLAIPWGAAAAQ